jgi:hypothetical protein
VTPKEIALKEVLRHLEYGERGQEHTQSLKDMMAVHRRG